MRNTGDRYVAFKQVHLLQQTQETFQLVLG